MEIFPKVLSWIHLVYPLWYSENQALCAVAVARANRVGVAKQGGAIRSLWIWQKQGTILRRVCAHGFWLEVTPSCGGIHPHQYWTSLFEGEDARGADGLTSTVELEKHS